jgi:hypothetical protein
MLHHAHFVSKGGKRLFAALCAEVGCAGTLLPSAAIAPAPAIGEQHVGLVREIY